MVNRKKFTQKWNKQVRLKQLSLEKYILIHRIVIGKSCSTIMTSSHLRIFLEKWFQI